MRLWLKRLFLFGLVAGLIGTVVFFLFAPKPVLVDMLPVTRGPLRVTVDEDGRTRIKERYVVSTPLAGRLQRITLKAGDTIAAGKTTLATIESTVAELLDPRAQAEAEARVKATDAKLKHAGPALEKAKTALQFAETELGRVRALHEKSAASKQEFERKEQLFRAAEQDYRAEVFAEEIARFELEQAQAALLQTQSEGTSNGEGRRFEIHAPISGRVLRVFEESAKYVTAGSRLLEVGNPSDLEIEVDVLSRDAVRIQPGAEVLIEQWGGDVPLRGSVRLVEPAGFMKVSALGVEEQRVNVIIDFVDPPDKRTALGDEFGVDARIVTWESDDVLKIPAGALFRYQDNWAVFVVKEGIAHRTPIEVGKRNALEAQVLGGLEKDETIIVRPSDKVEDGVKVEPRL